MTNFAQTDSVLGEALEPARAAPLIQVSQEEGDPRAF